MLHLATTTAPLRKRRTRLGDAPFIAALDFADFRDAPTIARYMLAAGTPAMLATIAKRMAEFVRHTDAVEARGQEWRLSIANDDTPPPILPTPVNDNAATLPIGLHHGCGLELMRSLPDASIDLVLADLPYGVTRLAIDPVIDVAEWMAEMHRVETDRGAIVAFGTQPFTTDLIMAGRATFKQALVWEKPQPTGFNQSHVRHLKAHEDILVFSKGTVIGKRGCRQMTYNPQGATKAVKVHRAKNRSVGYLAQQHSTKAAGTAYSGLINCPRSVLRYAKDSKAHPFAKPVALLEYLIRTYTNDNAVVLDPTMGSGSAGLAALATGRQFIGAENGTDRKGQCVFSSAAERIARMARGA